MISLMVEIAGERIPGAWQYLSKKGLIFSFPKRGRSSRTPDVGQHPQIGDRPPQSL